MKKNEDLYQFGVVLLPKNEGVWRKRKQIVLPAQNASAKCKKDIKVKW